MPVDPAVYLPTTLLGSQALTTMGCLVPGACYGELCSHCWKLQGAACRATKGVSSTFNRQLGSLLSPISHGQSVP